MRTADFDYDLPPACIADHPVRPRDHARLLAVGIAESQDRRIADLPDADLQRAAVANEARGVKADGVFGIADRLGRPPGQAPGRGPMGADRTGRDPGWMKRATPACNMVQVVRRCPRGDERSRRVVDRESGVFSSGGCARMKTAITAEHGVGWRGRVLAAL